MSKPTSDSRFTAAQADEFEKLESDLSRFAFRLGHLCSVDAELLRVTRDKLFLPSLPMWDLIDLASWALGFYEKGAGGFLRKLRGDDFRALKLKWKGQVNPWRKEAFDRLFPGADQWPRQDDVDRLGERLSVHFKPLHDDRNEYRAHRHERGKESNAKELALADVPKRLRVCQQVLERARAEAQGSAE